MKITVLLLVILGLAFIVTGAIIAFFTPIRTTRTIASHGISTYTFTSAGIIRYSNSTEGSTESNSTQNTCQECANSIGYIPIAIGLVLLSTALVEKKRK